MHLPLYIYLHKKVQIRMTECVLIKGSLFPPPPLSESLSLPVDQTQSL